MQIIVYKLINSFIFILIEYLSDYFNVIYCKLLEMNMIKHKIKEFRKEFRIIYYFAHYCKNNIKTACFYETLY